MEGERHPGGLERLEVRRDARGGIQRIAHPVDDEEGPVDQVRDEEIAVGAGGGIGQHGEVADERQHRRPQRGLAHRQEVGAGGAIGRAGEIDVRLVDVVLPLHAIDERQDVVDLRTVPPRGVAPAERVHDDLRLAGQAVGATPPPLLGVLAIDAAVELHPQRPASRRVVGGGHLDVVVERQAARAGRAQGAFAGRRGGVGASGLEARPRLVEADARLAQALGLAGRRPSPIRRASTPASACRPGPAARRERPAPITAANAPATSATRQSAATRRRPDHVCAPRNGRTASRPNRRILTCQPGRAKGCAPTVASPLPPSPPPYRFAVAIGAVAALWAAVIAATGGVSIAIGSVRLSSRSPWRPAVVALLLLAVGVVAHLGSRAPPVAGRGCGHPRSPSHRGRRAAPRSPWRWSRPSTAPTSPAAPTAAVTSASRGCGRRDGSPWPHRSCREAPWPARGYLVAPLGYRPTPRPDELGPSYAPGLPWLMALGAAALGDAGRYVWTPVLAGRAGVGHLPARGDDGTAGWRRWARRSSWPAAHRCCSRPRRR